MFRLEFKPKLGQRETVTGRHLAGRVVVVGRDGNPRVSTLRFARLELAGVSRFPPVGYSPHAEVVRRDDNTLTVAERSSVEGSEET